MKSVITTERSLIAAFVISDIASFLLLLMNIFNNMPGDREVVPIFLMIIPAIYLETKRRLKTEESRGFHYKIVLRVLFSCLVITESMNIILILF
jgi:hypothetical protein